MFNVGDEIVVFIHSNPARLAGRYNFDHPYRCRVVDVDELDESFKVEISCGTMTIRPTKSNEIYCLSLAEAQKLYPEYEF